MSVVIATSRLKGVHMTSDLLVCGGSKPYMSASKVALYGRTLVGCVGGMPNIARLRASGDLEELALSETLDLPGLDKWWSDHYEAFAGDDECDVLLARPGSPLVALDASGPSFIRDDVYATGSGAAAALGAFYALEAHTRSGSSMLTQAILAAGAVDPFCGGVSPVLTVLTEEE